MGKSDWPDTTALTNRMTGLGVTSIPTGVTLQDELDAAVEVLEKESGFSPFKEQASAADYKFDPSRRTFLDLRGRWTSITSVTVDGETQVAGTNYWAKPYGGPYTSLEFTVPVIGDGEPEVVTVNGKRGYATTIPVEVYNAVLDYAAGKVYEKAAAAGTVASGTVSEIKQDTVTIKYGSGGSGGAASGTAESLMESALEVFRRYRFVSLGGF